MKSKNGGHIDGPHKVLPATNDNEKEPVRISGRTKQRLNPDLTPPPAPR